MNNPVGWFEIYVQDMARAQAFYEAVLSVKLNPLDMPDIDMMTFPMEQDGAGSSGALVKLEEVSSGGYNVLVYFSCADCANEQQKAVENGGSVIKEKYSIGEYGFISLVTDTEGNTIGLHSNA